MSGKRLVQNTAPTYVHLDMARGIAALTVLLGHLRSFVFVSYGDLRSHSPLDTLVWTLTGFGHQAVMVFFVLSGFFISRSIAEDNKRGGFSWPIYTIKRLSRLWIVLVPALILTLAWDRLGMFTIGTSFYEGNLFSVYNSGPSVESGGAHLDAGAFFGNILFLQTIIVPIFGSNGPLWSLANEFWYYVMYPLILFAILRYQRPLESALNASLFVVVCIFVGKYMVISGLIWLAGAGIHVVDERDWLAAFLRSRMAIALGLLAFLAALALSKTEHGTETSRDLVVGGASTVLVLVLAKHQGLGEAYDRVARALANSSYTMYLAHFPFMAFVVNVTLRNQKYQASSAGYTAFLCIAAVTIAYCLGMYWLFERHTATVKRFCLSQYKLAHPGVKI
jgi:peptidoglycan/LPS O-acetylase OafA/YrhL